MDFVLEVLGLLKLKFEVKGVVLKERRIRFLIDLLFLIVLVYFYVLFNYIIKILIWNKN